MEQPSDSDVQDLHMVMQLFRLDRDGSSGMIVVATVRALLGGSMPDLS